MTSATAEHDTHDEGHDENADAGSTKPSYDDVNTPVIVLVGLISAVVTLLTIFFVQGLCYHWQNSFYERRADEYEKKLEKGEIMDTQKAQLDSAPISIEDAMNKVVEQYGKK